MGLCWLPRLMARTQDEGKKGKLQSDLTFYIQRYQPGHLGQVKRSQKQQSCHQPRPQEVDLKTGRGGTCLKNTVVIMSVLSVPQRGVRGTPREPLVQVRNA